MYKVLPTLLDIALMNHKNTAQQLFNISEDIYKSFYHIVFLEVCRAYQIIPCIGKPSDTFLDSWEKELENTGVNLRELLIEEYVRKLFHLITQFKSTIIRICILHPLHILIVMINFLILNIIFLSFVTLLFQILETFIILFI